MFWIALELSIPKIGFNIMLSLTVKKVDAFKFDGVAESDNTVTIARFFAVTFCPSSTTKKPDVVHRTHDMRGGCCILVIELNVKHNLILIFF